MEAGLNNLIKKIASELFIKYESGERRKIGRSVDNILNRLDEYFDDEMDEAIVFGSFSRDTILPRKYDMNSDIDILVQFNTTDFDKLKPESHRNQLKKFAETNYPNSSVVKDHPSV
ncbi:MAG TPA: nucleotidyltransferase domain-containing protein, partial [Chitinophagaceae bacterium]|nr:nucleotidyltransferase domain-containing protein [Chitinophagaceae bacterium]